MRILPCLWQRPLPANLDSIHNAEVHDDSSARVNLGGFARTDDDDLRGPLSFVPEEVSLRPLCWCGGGEVYHTQVCVCVAHP